MYKNENGKLVLEGEGTVKANNESKPVAFKFVRHVLTEKQNGESGTSVSLYMGEWKLLAVCDSKNYRLQPTN